MKNVTDNMNDQFKKAMDMQSTSLEPMRVFAATAADAVEQIARKNYAVIGDMLEYSTKQVHLPLASDNLNEVTSAQVADASAFMELMNSRTAEYAEMARQFSSKAKEASEGVAASFK